MNLSERIRKFVRGDEQAYEFLMSIHRIVDTWDDLIDKDKPISDDEINNAFHMALIGIPRNPFYRANFALLNPLLESAIVDWHTANVLEKRGDEVSLREAYVIRCSIYTLDIMSARILGGNDWALAVSLEIRSFGNEWPLYAAKHGMN